MSLGKGRRLNGANPLNVSQGTRTVVQQSDGFSSPVLIAADPNGVAADHGFILDVSGKSVASPADVRTQIADARKEGKHTLLFRVKSNAGTRFVALPLGNA